MTRLGLGILVAVLLIILLRRELMIKSTALPIGKPVRVGDDLADQDPLVRTPEPVILDSSPRVPVLPKREPLPDFKRH